MRPGTLAKAILVTAMKKQRLNTKTRYTWPEFFYLPIDVKIVRWVV